MNKMEKKKKATESTNSMNQAEKRLCEVEDRRNSEEDKGRRMEV